MIAYSGYDGSDDEIYTIAPSGGTPTNVTNNTTHDFSPSFSPDGSKIVYTARYTGSYSDIYTIPSNGGTPTQLTNTPTTDEMHPSFSPDSQKIAYTSRDDGPSDIYTISPNGGTPTKVTNNTTLSEEHPSFSPDGQKIAIMGWDGRDQEIYTIPSNGGTPTKVTNNPTTYDSHPSFSPDGQKIAYDRHDGNDGEIYTIPSNGGTPTQLTNNTTGDGLPDWGVLYVPDATPPETSIDSGPDGSTSDSTPTFSFSGSDDETAAADLLFSYKVDDGDWSEYSSQTTVTLGSQTSLSDDSHTFFVRAKDEADNVDESPAERTFEVDATPPTVVSVKPANGEKGVRRGINVTATFSEEMNPDTLTRSTVFLLNTKTGRAVKAEVSCDDPCTTVTINPWKRMVSNARHKAVIITSASDLYGHTMEKNYTWTFKTGAR